jgi:hypothetical protein
MMTQKTQQFFCALVLGIAQLSLAIPTHAATTHSVIGIQGQRLPSIFDGLKPSWFAAERMVPKPHIRSRRQRPLVQPDGPQQFGGRFVRAFCPDCPQETACAGDYVRIVELPPGVGCSDPLGCPTVNNFEVDPSDPSLVGIGEVDTYCGLTCCWDAQPC